MTAIINHSSSIISSRLRRWVAVLILGLVSGSSSAQSLYPVMYRPPGVSYAVMPTKHFDIIFQRGLEDFASQAARTLESHYDAALKTAGARRAFRMPVVLNGFNDLSNGYVTPFPFRQEIESGPIKGKILSPAHHDWSEQVLGHELVHAMQAQVRPRVGIGGALGLLSPDWNRILNFSIPPGFTEGLAVRRESRLESGAGDIGAGRLNHSFSAMQFHAAVASGKTWRMSQIGDPPAYTFPLDRYYIGGGFLTDWLADQYGTDHFEQTLRLYNRWPFFGYGAALWTSTGTPPWKIGRRFRQAASLAEVARQSLLGETTEPRVLWGKTGVFCRRPDWLDNNTILVYASGYALRSGFYSVDAGTASRKTISNQAITEDYWHDLDRDTGELLFARYRPALAVSVKETSDVFALQTTSGKARALTSGKRTFGPARLADGGILALRYAGQYTELVRISTTGDVSPLSGPGDRYIKEILVHPDGGHTLALVNYRGRQGIDRIRFDELRNGYVLEPFVYLDDGSIYDPVWSDNGAYIVFAADPDGVSNIYAFKTADSTLSRLSNVRFGAFEPSVSPNGEQLAFVHYEHEQYQLATVPFTPANAVDRSEYLNNEVFVEVDLANPHSETLPGISADVFRSYRAVDHLLAPRALYPFVTVDEQDLDPTDTEIGLGLGATITGTDPLQTWAYGISSYYQAEQLWGSFGVQTGKTVLRPALKVWSEPFTAGVLDVDPMSGKQFVRRGVFEEQGVRLSTSVPLRLARNVYSTTARFRLRGELQRYREIDESSRALGPYVTRAFLEPGLSFGWRLQSNRRDLLPNSGILVTSSAETDIYTSDGLTPRNALRTDVSLYVPWLSHLNHGIKFSLDVLAQDRGSIFNLDSFVPRGYEDLLYLDEGTFAKVGVEHRMPVRYIDNGFLMLPVSFEAIYVYWFAETMTKMSGGDGGTLKSSVGAGLGLRLSLVHHLRLDLRLGIARLLEDNEWEAVYR